LIDELDIVLTSSFMKFGHWGLCRYLVLSIALNCLL
jgi:hypothetical protein